MAVVLALLPVGLVVAAVVVVSMALRTWTLSRARTEARLEVRRALENVHVTGWDGADTRLEHVVFDDE